MTTTSLEYAPPRSTLLAAAVLGGSIAATIDIAYAFAWWGAKGVTPVQILHSIASGWQGRAAFDGGVPSAVLGAVSHYGILIVAAALFVAASRHWRMLTERAWLAGFAYGACIWLVMNDVVVPLSAAPPSKPGPFFTATTITGILVHVVLLGPAISLAARRLR